MYPTLPKLEIVAYFVLWFGFYGWAIIQVFLLSVSKAYKRLGIIHGDLQSVDEFYIPNKLKDISDYEWSQWNYWLWQMVVCCYVLHFCLMRLVELIAKKFRFHASMLFSVGFCIYFYNFKGLFYLIAQSLLCFSLTYFTKSVKVTWAVCVMAICAFNSSYAIAQLEKLYYNDHNLLVSFICASSTCSLRYTAFCLEYCWESNAKSAKKDDCTKNCAKTSALDSILTLFLYQFYFPLFAGGPIINCNDFLQQIKKEPTTWSRSVIIRFFRGICRYSLWHIFTNAFLHYFYFGSMHYDDKLMNSVPILTLCGLGLCNVQFFCLKYMVMYGLPSKISVADNLDVPGAAHCVSAKHKFTFMWKYFDKGLHKWLVRYIFIPLGGTNKSLGVLRNLITSMLVFSFVYLWHGLRNDHLVWASLNWLGVFIEKIASDVYKKPVVQDFERKYLSPSMSRRIRAAISTPLFSLLIISNIYFLSGIYTTNIYMKRIYTEVFGGINRKQKYFLKHEMA